MSLERFKQIAKNAINLILYSFSNYGYKIAKLPHISTGIIAHPIVQKFLSSANTTYENGEDARFQIIWAKINKDLICSSIDDSIQLTYHDFVENYRKHFMVGFIVEDVTSSVQLCAQLRRDKLIDAFIASSDTDILIAAWKENPEVGRVYILSERFSNETVLEKLNLGKTRIVAVSAENYNREMGFYFNNRLIQVWGYSDQLDKYEIANLISSGINGLCTINPSSIVKVLSGYNFGKIVTRRPIIIGHRGISTDVTYMENTVSTAIVSKRSGSTIIDADTRLTSDGKLIVFHGKIIDRVLKGSGATDKFSFQELERMEYRYGVVPNEKVCLLEDFMLSMIGLFPDVMFTVEIGGYIVETIDIIVDMLDRNPVLKDRVIIKCKDGFYGKGEIEERLPTVIPRIYTEQMVSSYLCNSKSIVNALKQLRINNVAMSDYNPRFNTKLCDALIQRGCSVLFILQNSEDYIIRSILSGSNLLMGNVKMISHFAYEAEIETETPQVKVGDTIKIATKVKQIDGGVLEPNYTYTHFISGNDCVELVDDNILAIRSGEVCLQKYVITECFKSKYYVLSNCIRIYIEE